MQDLGANAGDFDDDEGGGLSLNARSRAILMQKLDRSGSGSGIAGPLGTPAVNSPGVSLPMALPTAPLLGAAPVVSPLVPPITAVPGIAGLGVAGLQIPTASLPSMDTIGVPSEFLLLKNMFDPAVETEPNFDLDIKEDVQEECSKYGNLRHIFVDNNTAGHVYLRFENTQAAINTRHVLRGRWFAGKMIEATFMMTELALAVKLRFVFFGFGCFVLRGSELGVAGLQIPTATLPSIDTIGVPSECLLLKNMFDPAVETEPNFDLDIKEDVQEECSKYGNLRHILVDKNTAGHVYLRFENTQAAINAQHVLHGRWFAGNMIEATFMLPQNYEAKFMESR
ncbi:unnamed protein product [Prunus armeniaca]